jgi:hypothetical protein
VIRLHPIPDSEHRCPYCGTLLIAVGWWIPGMRTLGELTCSSCDRHFYGDLASGFGLLYPMLLERETGLVHDSFGVRWFSDWLRESYASRTARPPRIVVEERRPVRRPLVLDCLDGLYGHALLKLLNAQYYLDHHPEIDLVVLVARALRWLVPEEVAEVWTLEEPLPRGRAWNDGLAESLHARLDGFPEAFLSLALPHPNPSEYEIERFTGVARRPLTRGEPPTEPSSVTFVWREDRAWATAASPSSPFRRRSSQTDHVGELAKRLQSLLGGVRFTVVGLGQAGELPSWIDDVRSQQPDPSLERSWCERYAESDAVVGVHGSNMLLASAYATTVFELVPSDRLQNIPQSLLVPATDSRDALLRFRFLPISATPRDVAAAVAASLVYRSATEISYGLFSLRREDLQRDPLALTRWHKARERAALGPADGW